MSGKKIWKNKDRLPFKCNCWTWDLGIVKMQFVKFLYLVLGVWSPDHVEGNKRILFKFYWFFSYMWTIGAYVIIQLGELCLVWGNVSEMTGVLFLLSTNVCQSVKLFNAAMKRDVVKKLIKEFDEEIDENTQDAGVVESFDHEGKIQLYVYLFMSASCILGWFISTEKGELHFQAWYPYDVTKSPAYELSYAHQSIALPIAALLNISSDTLVTSLIALCRCRIRLLALSFTRLCDGLQVNEKDMLSAKDEELVELRLKRCAAHHEACLRHARLIEEDFSAPILIQFCVSMVIICVSGYQLAFESTNASDMIGMAFYVTVMAYQVFIYCYQGNELLLESENILSAAYGTLWYTFSAKLRRTLLIIMTRTQRAARLTAGGFTQISLTCFTAIIKTSYSLFTLLQRVEV